MRTEEYCLIFALRIRVHKSAMGSGINIIVALLMTSIYQLDLVTPGINPKPALSRKQRRHIPNFRRYPRERPQKEQRLYSRTLNFCFLEALWMSDNFAIIVWVDYFRKGNPNPSIKAFASSFDEVDVTIVIFMPRTLSILS